MAYSMRLWIKVTAGLLATGWVLYFTIYFSIPRQRTVIPVSRWWKEASARKRPVWTDPPTHVQPAPNVIAKPLAPPPDYYLTQRPSSVEAGLSSVPATDGPESGPSSPVAAVNSSSAEHNLADRVDIPLENSPLQEEKTSSAPKKNVSVVVQKAGPPPGNDPKLSVIVPNEPVVTNSGSISSSSKRADAVSQNHVPVLNQAALPALNENLQEVNGTQLSQRNDVNLSQVTGHRDGSIPKQPGRPLQPAESLAWVENVINEQNNVTDQQLNAIVKELLDKNTQEAFLQMFGPQSAGIHKLFKRHWQHMESGKGSSSVLNDTAVDELLGNIKENMVHAFGTRDEAKGNDAPGQKWKEMLRSEAYSAVNVQNVSKPQTGGNESKPVYSQRGNVTKPSEESRQKAFLPPEAPRTSQNIADEQNTTSTTEQIMDIVNKLVDEQKETLLGVLGLQNETNSAETNSTLLLKEYWQLFFSGDNDTLATLNETAVSGLFDGVKADFNQMLGPENETARRGLKHYVQQLPLADQQTLNETSGQTLNETSGQTLNETSGQTLNETTDARNASESGPELVIADIYSSIRQTTLAAYFRENGMRAKEDLGKQTSPVRMTEMEDFYIQSPALENITFLPDELQSEVTILSPADSYKVGDRIQLRVDVRDQLGRIRDAGGDEVRVWLKSPDRDSSAPAEVSDLGNGSYVGETTLRWAGPTHVQASLTYPREFLRLSVELRHSLLATRWITAKFIKAENAVETTPCLPSAPIPGYAGTCNYTLDNGWSPWFCGQPTDPELSCGHMTHVVYLPLFSPLPLDGPALEMNEQLNDGSRGLRLIPNDIEICTLPGSPPPQLPPCSSRPRRESWELFSQRGWMKKPAGEWIPDTCALPAFAPKRVRECLRDTTVLLLGDSNMRSMFDELRKDLGIKESVFWFGQRLIRMPRLNNTLLFAAHAHPYHSGHPYPVMRPVSVGRALAGLPVGGRYVIVLHYYLHFAYYPLAVFTDRVRSAKRAVEKFLRAHPTAKVFIRGPHVVNDGGGNHATNGDKFGPWFLRILKQEFQDLHDRIWLLDFWPMTIAVENEDADPPDHVTRQMLRVLLGYACDTA